MKQTIFLAGAMLLATPLAAFAQSMSTPTPDQQALGATVMACVQESVSLRTQIFTLQAELERLKSTAKPAETPAKP